MSRSHEFLVIFCLHGTAATDGQYLSVE